MPEKKGSLKDFKKGQTYWTMKKCALYFKPYLKEDFGTLAYVSALWREASSFRFPTRFTFLLSHYYLTLLTNAFVSCRASNPNLQPSGTLYVPHKTF